MRIKEESEKVGLKLSIQKTKIITSSPITSWQVGKKKQKWWYILFFLYSKITALVTALMKENYDKPRQHILKQRHHFADKGPYN